jgi:hypothetical protein
MISLRRRVIFFTLADKPTSATRLHNESLRDSSRLGGFASKMIDQTHLAKRALPELAFVVRLTAIRSLAI